MTTSELIPTSEAVTEVVDAVLINNTMQLFQVLLVFAFVAFVAFCLYKFLKLFF